LFEFTAVVPIPTFPPEIHMRWIPEVSKARYEFPAKWIPVDGSLVKLYVGADTVPSSPRNLPVAMVPGLISVDALKAAIGRTRLFATALTVVDSTVVESPTQLMPFDEVATAKVPTPPAIH
jgi:hypothetical protein